MSRRAAVRRRFPRLPCNRPGEMEVRLQDASFRVERVRVPVVIRSISCEGVGVEIEQRKVLPLPRGAHVTIRFQVSREEMEIPGRIAWSRRAGGEGEPGGAADLGVRFHLELARRATRQAYAIWIVDQMNRQAPAEP